LFLFFSFFARPDPTEGKGESIAGTTRPATNNETVADEPELFESERNRFEMINESEVRKSAIQQQTQTLKANVVAPQPIAGQEISPRP
jgi:hypothetical protein